MPQVTDANSAVALPVRIHDLLLGLAGKLDDDALADARELLASAELDRTLEFVVGSLVAGRIVVTHAQRDELRVLTTRVNLDASLVERVLVDGAAASVRHRFFGGVVAGAHAGDGVTEAARHVLEVLPDVRTVWAAWRLTPAGAVSGPVPHRVVLVGVGPHGFAPATAFRIEDALRRAGIRASVEVLRDGTEPFDYHRSAMHHAAQIEVAREASASPFTGVNESHADLAPTTAPIAPVLNDTPPRPHRSVASGERPAPSPARRPDRAKPVAPPTDEALNDQERDLLRQLQEELARRELESGGEKTGGMPALDWSNNGKPSIVNGAQPPDPDQRH